MGGNFDSVARGGASLLGSGLLVLALCADKERLEAQQNSALWVPDFGRPGPVALGRPWRPKSGPSRDSLAMPFLGPAIARLLGFLMSPTRALRVTLWEPYSSFPHSTIHSDNYIIAP